MAHFTPRKKSPSATNKYYIKTTFGGYNRCIQIQLDGSVLPNCVGYAWGRFCECQENVHDCNLSRGDAENWYGNTSDGYERGQDPKLGAVICWSDSAGEGHVAIVEEILNNNEIVTSNSAYGGSRFYLKNLKRSNNYYMGSTYTFQGFIYNPTNFDDPNKPTEQSKRKGFNWVIFTRKIRKRRLTQS